MSGKPSKDEGRKDILGRDKGLAKEISSVPEKYTGHEQPTYKSPAVPILPPKEEPKPTKKVKP